MGVISELKNRGMDIVKTDKFFRGLRDTEKGVVVSQSESECDDGDGNRIYFLEVNEKLIPCNDWIMYITHGTEYQGASLSLSELQELAEEGKIFSFKSSDLYEEFYGFFENLDLACAFKYNYSAKSRLYIEGVMHDIGMLSYTDVPNSSGQEEGEISQFDVIETYDTYFCSSNPTFVGKLGGNYIAQTARQIDFDDYAVIKMHFDHLPKENEIRLAFGIREFERNPIEIFKCYECGHVTHWTECEGDIWRKHHLAKEKWCGC